RSSRSKRSNRWAAGRYALPILLAQAFFNIVVTEYLREVVKKPLCYFGRILLSAELSRHRSYAGPGKTTGNDALEVNKIRIHVQRQAVKGDASSNGDANGGDLVITDPNSREGWSAGACEAKVVQGSNCRQFEIPHVPMHILAQLRAEIDDRIN